MEQLHIEFLKTKEAQANYLQKLEDDYNKSTPNYPKKDDHPLVRRVGELQHVIKSLSGYPPTILIACKRNNDDYIGGMGLWIINLQDKHYCCCLDIHKFRSLMEEEYTQNEMYSDVPEKNPYLNVSLALVKTTIDLAKHLNIEIIYLPKDCGRGPGRLWSKYGALYTRGHSNSYEKNEDGNSKRFDKDKKLLKRWTEEYEIIKNMIRNDEVVQDKVPPGEMQAKFIFFVDDHKVHHKDIQEAEDKLSITKDGYPDIDELSIITSTITVPMFSHTLERNNSKLSLVSSFSSLPKVFKNKLTTKGGKKKLTKKRTRQTKRRRHTKRKRPTKRRR
tara:strand:+ start:146 stop:1141 length:996 start_codon:yes stop_codon:yes gene_type:complete